MGSRAAPHCHGTEHLSRDALHPISFTSLFFPQGPLLPPVNLLWGYIKSGVNVFCQVSCTTLVFLLLLLFFYLEISSVRSNGSMGEKHLGHLQMSDSVFGDRHLWLWRWSGWENGFRLSHTAAASPLPAQSCRRQKSTLLYFFMARRHFCSRMPHSVGVHWTEAVVPIDICGWFVLSKAHPAKMGVHS